MGESCKLCVQHDDGDGVITRIRLCHNDVGVIGILEDLVDSTDLSGNTTLVDDIAAWIIDNNAVLPSGGTITKRNCDVDFGYDPYVLCFIDSTGDIMIKARVTEKQDGETGDTVGVTKVSIDQSNDTATYPINEIYKSHLNQVTYVSGSADDGNLVVDVDGTEMTQTDCIGCGDCGNTTTPVAIPIMSAIAGEIVVSNSVVFAVGDKFENNATEYEITEVVDNGDGTETLKFTPGDLLSGSITALAALPFSDHICAGTTYGPVALMVEDLSAKTLRFYTDPDFATRNGNNMAWYSPIGFVPSNDDSVYINVFGQTATGEFLLGTTYTTGIDQGREYIEYAVDETYLSTGWTSYIAEFKSKATADGATIEEYCFGPF